MRGHKTNKLAGPCLLGAGVGLIYAQKRRLRSTRPLACAVVGAAVEPTRVDRAPARPTATERALALFPSLAVGTRPQITGEEARDSTRGYGAEVYAVYIYYHNDAGQNFRRATHLSKITRSFEVSDWGAVERVEVLFNDKSQADFYLKEGVVVG